MVIVFDLDGTLANLEHRLHYINIDSNWPAFYRACKDDKPIWPLISVCREMCRTHWVEIWSGRSDEVRAITVSWLAAHGLVGVDDPSEPYGRYRALRMRPTGSNMQDSMLKGKWFDELPTALKPELAFDDREQMVRMWRSKGVLCAQVAEGKY